MLGTIATQMDRMQEKIDDNNLKIFSIPQVPSKNMLNRNFHKKSDLLMMNLWKNH